MCIRDRACWASSRVASPLPNFTRSADARRSGKATSRGKSKPFSRRRRTVSNVVHSRTGSPVARDFYSELTHAVKRFLERATGEPVLEWTTFETVRRLREKGFDFPREAAFPDLLASADRVKFGKGDATREDAQQALARARLV